ncbi:chromosome transmission fidelity protein 1 [Geosmithia morbida]|uniref:ATP-dependent DNA helicase CHL1 n=1 Tax=Geosmithia morbida TaxID=1094350 RepID=A0A9P4YSM3_9HYPO|nr:chromosome transmission fidelity protein 1 [Geosmithia morbida]KAF4120911.1 chromosome transmission fidelity protein 1 [Geosmithia morbida]
MSTDVEVGGVAASLGNLDFHHPLTPYDVQEQFMKAVYDVLEAGNGQVGILESPTGTGKSLSLICATLTWLRNHKSSAHEATLQQASEAYKDEPSWMIDQLLRQKRNELLRQWEDREKRLEAARLKERALEERVRKRRRIEDGLTSTLSHRSTEDEDAEWLLDSTSNDKNDLQDPLSGLSRESKEILTKIGLGKYKGPRAAEEEVKLEEGIKIYYTSRTHSQLSQFITELRRPAFPSSLPKSLAQDGAPPQNETVKLLPLSSRQRLCINPSVSRLGSVQAINDRCSELQQPKFGKKCPYVPKEELLSQTNDFRDSALASIPDIEDLHQLGKSLAVCPYYASRTALPGAEIVTLPYPLLLQQSAREALGIKLEGNVVVIDEAHNIMDAIANVHTAEIQLSDMKRARCMLSVYVKRFGKKLKGENRVNVGRVGRVIEGLTEWMEGAIKLKEHGIVDPNDLTRHKGIDQINMYELIKYIQESKLAFKIESYVAHVESEKDPKATSRHSSSPVLHSLVSFLVALTNLSSEGRIFYEKTAGENTSPNLRLSYLLLSPTHAFSSIASSARAVILAGGTMSPFDDYKDHLFPTMDQTRITTLSCGHVIPKENLCVWTLASMTPGAAPFEFSFQRRGDRDMITKLGLALVNGCSVIPDGVVVFFPSYAYLDEVVKVWQQGEGQTVWSRLEARKSVFRESKGSSNDEVLDSYSRAILDQSGSKGALLLSVVGGKMSEGINFSDRLGRCVMVVGLPYPNIASPDWKAKIEYIESTMYTRLLGNGEGEDGKKMSETEARTRAKQASRDFYENACMRAVNQSVGRAIRHRNDYAAIVLVDRRFGTDRIRSKLPGWIRAGMQTGSEHKGLGGLMGTLGGFFREKR